VKTGAVTNSLPFEHVACPRADPSQIMGLGTPAFQGEMGLGLGSINQPKK